jgi:hypothetical protein
MIRFYTYNYCTHFYPCRCSRRQDMGFLPEMVAPVLVLVVAPTQRPNPTEARPGHGDQPPRLRDPLAGRLDSAHPPRAHEPISDFGQGLPPRGYGSAPQHTPALAHNALNPQAIARKRAFRKATHRFAPPATRKRTCLPRASTTAVRRGFGWFCQGVGHGLTFGAAAPASASQHITSAGTRPSPSPRRPAPATPHRPESP